MKDFYLKPKLFSVMKNYSKEQLIKDVVAGIIVAVIALPLSIALAIASGVEPACGIYTAIAAGFIVSLLGGSRAQIAGPTAAFATTVAGIVAVNGMGGLFIATVMAGIILILMGVFKLGALIKYIPATITTGFTAGIAVTILVGQIKDFLGLTYQSGVKPIETFEKIEANIDAIATFSPAALVIGIISLAILIIYPKFEKKVPPSLIAVVASVLLVKFIPFFDNGVSTIGDLYTIPAGLPKVDFSAIDFSFENVTSLIPSAVTIAVLAAIESLLSCVVADNMLNSKHNPNAELVAQGTANIASVLFGGIPATGAIARTAANIKNGGKTPIAGMVHAAVLFAVLMVLMPLAKLIPMPTIAAILFVVAYNMSEWRHFVRICKTSPKSDILVLVVTFVLTVAFDLVVAIAVGMILAIVLFMKRMSDKTEVSLWDNDMEDGIKLPQGIQVFEVNGPLFFGSADKILDIALAHDTKVVIVRMRGVNALDATAMDSLETLYKKCKNKNISIIFSHLNLQPYQTMKKAGFYDEVGEENFCPHISDAVELACEKIK